MTFFTYVPLVAHTDYRTTVPPTLTLWRVPHITGSLLSSVQAVELSSGTKGNITITHDKMNLSNTDIERMIKEAEDSHATDSAARAKVEARNALQAYAYELASTVRNEKVREGD